MLKSLYNKNDVSKSRADGRRPVDVPIFQADQKSVMTFKETIRTATVLTPNDVKLIILGDFLRAFAGILKYGRYGIGK